MRMKRTAVLLLLAATLPGCRPAAEEPPPSETAQSAVPAPAASPELTDRIWIRTDPSAPVGEMRAFLTDGSLLMDSCWETYRLVRWSQTGDTLVWDEDGAEIKAEIVSLTAQELHLRLSLVDGPKDERYQPATVPFTCPDMAR